MYSVRTRNNDIVHVCMEIREHFQGVNSTVSRLYCYYIIISPVHNNYGNSCIVYLQGSTGTALFWPGPVISRDRD